MSQFLLLFVTCVIAVVTANKMPARHHLEDSAELEQRYKPTVTSLAHGLHRLSYKNELGHETCLACDPLTADQQDPALKCGCADLAAIQCQTKSLHTKVTLMQEMAKKVEAFLPNVKTIAAPQIEKTPVATKTNVVPTTVSAVGPRGVNPMGVPHTMIGPMPMQPTVILKPGQKAGACGPVPPCAPPMPWSPQEPIECNKDSDCPGVNKCCPFCGRKCMAPIMEDGFIYIESDAKPDVVPTSISPVSPMPSGPAKIVNTGTQVNPYPVPSGPTKPIMTMPVNPNPVPVPVLKLATPINPNPVPAGPTAPIMATPINPNPVPSGPTAPIMTMPVSTPPTGPTMRVPTMPTNPEGINHPTGGLNPMGVPHMVVHTILPMQPTEVILKPGQRAGACGPLPPCARPTPQHPQVNECAKDSECPGVEKCCSFCGMKCKAPIMEARFKYVEPKEVD